MTCDSPTRASSVPKQFIFACVPQIRSALTAYSLKTQAPALVASTLQSAVNSRLALLHTHILGLYSALPFHLPNPLHLTTRFVVNRNNILPVQIRNLQKNEDQTD